MGAAVATTPHVYAYVHDYDYDHDYGLLGGAGG
jgi:hypothetical protein